MSPKSQPTSAWKKFRMVAGSGRRKIPPVLMLILLSGLMDSFAVALMAPFVGALINIGNELTGAKEVFAGLTLPQLCAIMIGVYAAKSLFTIGVQRSIAGATETIRADLMTRHLRALQRMPYQYHVTHTSSELINRNIWHVQAFTNNFVGAGLRLTADVVVAIAIAAIVAASSLIAAAFLLVVLACVFAIVLGLIRARSAEIARMNAQVQGRVMETVGQAIGAYKEVRILGAEGSFVKQLELATEQMIDASRGTAVVSALPRQAIELAMVLFLTGIAMLSMTVGSDASQLIPILGVVAAAAVRLMPATTSILANLGQIRANRFILDSLFDELQDTNPDDARNAAMPLDFQSIEAKHLTFSHADRSTPVINNIHLAIKSGEAIGIAGPSGAGKSTLVDLLLGFYEPDSGAILVNGQPMSKVRERWRKTAAYIPQSPYVLNDTIVRNIALGIETDQLDRKRLERAIEDSCLSDLVADLPDGLETILGERGVRLSGGQRQRIALARALYFDRQVLIMDEATSALDSETEEAIIATVRGLKGQRTLVVIAHRESSLQMCDRRITLVGDGTIHEEPAFEQSIGAIT